MASLKGGLHGEGGGETVPSTGNYGTGTPPGENVPGTGRPKITIDLPVPYLLGAGT